MLRKFWVLVNLVVLSNSFLIEPVMAEDEVKNEPVAGAEVTIATFDDTGKLVPIGTPVTVNKDGSFDFDVPSTIPAHKPLFILAQDPSGEGTQQMAAMPAEGEVQVTPDQTAITNTFLSLASKASSFTPKDIDTSQMDAFVQDMSNALGETAPAETAGDSITRAAQAMSFNPEAFLDAAGNFKVDPQELFEVASVIDEAAAPSSFNPLEGLPTISNEPSPGSHIMGLIPAGFMKQMPADFKPEQFCPTCPPPGGFEFHDASGKVAPIPPGTFMMPPGLQANSKVPFPDGAVFPQGVEIPKGFPMSANQVLPPGAILGEGFMPPPGMKIPEGIIAPANFDPAAFGAVRSTFQPPSGFVTPPGWGLADNKGGIMTPPGFALPQGTQMPAGAMAFPAPAGFTAPPLPPGSMATNIQPPPAGFTFGQGFTPPMGFNPTQSGFVAPAGFVQPTLGSKPQDMSAFKADGASFFDPFGGKGPSADGLFIPPALVGTFDPATAFAAAPPPPPGQGPNAGGNKPADGGAAPAPTGGAAPAPTGGAAPAQPTGGTAPAQPTGGTAPAQPTGGAAPANPPPPPSGGNAPPPPPPPSGGDAPPPPPPPSGGDAPPPPPPQARIKAPRVNNLSIDLTKRAPRKLRTVKALDASVSAEVGVKTIVNVTTGAKALGVTGSEGVYLVGKALNSATRAAVPIVVDPSTSSDSVKVNLSLSNKTVDTIDISLEKEHATQLVTQLDGKVIEMTTASTDIEDLGASKVTGYLLAPGTSTQKIMKAITIKGTVTDGAESGQLISFTLPANKVFADGVYTITFQDGDNTYYGKVTIGTLKARKISGKVLAPNGQL